MSPYQALAYNEEKVKAEKALAEFKLAYPMGS